MMELLPGNSPTIQQEMTAGNSAPETANTNSTATPAERLLAGIVRTGSKPPMESTNKSTPNNDFFYNNILGRLDTISLDFGGIGMTRPNLNRTKTASESSSNSSISCSSCEVNASIRCVECNEFMCNGCFHEHHNSPQSSNHSIISLPTPIGTSHNGGISASTMSAPSSNYVCDLHNEVLRYVCDNCKKLVCQCCTLHEHKEHNYVSIQSFANEANEKIKSAMESCRTGTMCIKGSIDKALTFIRLIERNFSELIENIHKAFRQLRTAIEDRERFLVEFVEKLRVGRQAILEDQIAGLKSVLSGLADISYTLHKMSENSSRMDDIDIALKILNVQRQLEQFAAIYKDLQAVTPDLNIFQDIRNQGAVVLVDEQNMPVVTGGAVLGGSVKDLGVVMPMASANMPVGSVPLPTNLRRPFMRENNFRCIPSPFLPVRGGNACGGNACGVQSTGLEWELNVLRTSPNLHFGAPRSTQVIHGCTEHVKARKSNAPSLSFATEGYYDGQVSRPWGLCVDKMGHILISDRSNNRVQVFNPDGTFKFKFGRKGVGNGEFYLPAGICVDIDNRIIVVDKDNHRVQIFTSRGVYLLKFGSFGKEYGQFQYPWDVAVNSRRQIVVTDSRNHRIQQFDSEGRFIRQIVFDNYGQNRGIASPRGVCYTPTGNIIVSDFDNHCLYLIDPDVKEILFAKGHEGSGFQEFNRPSGICCDDDGRIIVADSKNQRVLVYSSSLEYLWSIAKCPKINPLASPSIDEKDRISDVAVMPDGRIVFLIALSPNSKEGYNPYKRFVHAL